MTFSEYVAFYGLTRSEGVVLRYFADAYRALRRTVPTAARTEELTDITSWLGELVRGVDSSLLDEWEALAHPDADELILPGGLRRGPAAAGGRAGSPPTSGVSPSWCATRCFGGSNCWPARTTPRWASCTAARAGGPTRGRRRCTAYWDEYDDAGHRRRRPGPPRWSSIDRMPESWHVRQIFDDPAGDRDWGLSVEVDLAASDEAGEPVLTILDLGPATG